MSVSFLGTDCPYVVGAKSWKSNINSIIVLCGGHFWAIFTLYKGRIVICRFCITHGRSDLLNALSIFTQLDEQCAKNAQCNLVNRPRLEDDSKPIEFDGFK